jgi:hypothetical protein
MMEECYDVERHDEGMLWWENAMMEECYDGGMLW